VLVAVALLLALSNRSLMSPTLWTVMRQAVEPEVLVVPVGQVLQEDSVLPRVGLYFPTEQR